MRLWKAPIAAPEMNRQRGCVRTQPPGVSRVHASRPPSVVLLLIICACVCFKPSQPEVAASAAEMTQKVASADKAGVSMEVKIETSHP